MPRAKGMGRTEEQIIRGDHAADAALRKRLKELAPGAKINRGLTLGLAQGTSGQGHGGKVDRYL